MHIVSPMSRPLGLVFGLPLLLASAALWAEQPVFPSPEAAVDALIEAAKSDTPGAAADVLGPEAGELRSSDPVEDATERRSFVEAANQARNIALQGEDLATLIIGEQDWPFAIPLVRGDSGWYFDIEAGKEELLNRRIGGNELDTIAVAREYVEAQHEYASMDRDNDGKREYAQKIVSSEGERDGLYWPAGENEPASPIGRLIAEAVAEGYRPGGNAEPEPYHGYLFRVLTAQGDQAPGGAQDWMVDGHLTKGFGLIAYPAEYGNTGVMTFMVDESGLVMERDLGESTAELAAAITSYNPDRSWRLVTD
jgi:hypothetical protein